MNKLRWWHYELKRLWRLMRPEPSAALLIQIVGPTWLWRKGAKRELKIKLWAGTSGWYCVDLGFPDRMRAVEAFGGVHKNTYRQDVARDHRLRERGWEVLYINWDEMIANPKRVRKVVRGFIKHGYSKRTEDSMGYIRVR